MCNDNKELEFKSAEELHRFEANLMLGQTAVYIVATGALLNAVFSKDISNFNSIAIAIFGLFMSISFSFITDRCGKNLRGARKRAGELGEKLGFKLYSSKYRAPNSNFFVAKNVTKSICILGCALWVLHILNKLKCLQS